MIAVIHDPPRRLFDYWQKPVKGRLGRLCQNDRFITVIRLQNRSFHFPGGDETGFNPKTTHGLQIFASPS